MCLWSTSPSLLFPHFLDRAAYASVFKIFPLKCQLKEIFLVRPVMLLASMIRTLADDELNTTITLWSAADWLEKI